MRALAIVLLAISAAACTTPRLMRDGAPAASPAGWSDFCQRHPGYPRC